MKWVTWAQKIFLIGLCAWLVSGIINTLITHSLRSASLEDALSDDRSSSARRAQTSKNNRIIAERNLFQTAITGPLWNACKRLPIKSTWMLGKPFSSIQDGFELPDHHIHSFYGNCRCSDRPSCDRAVMQCSRITDAAQLMRHGIEPKRRSTALFVCRPQRPSWHELNMVCMVTSGKTIVHWQHLWSHDGKDRRVLAQAGQDPDGACTGVMELKGEGGG